MSEANRMQLPSPGWEPLTEGYFRAAAEGRLVVQRCGKCGYHRWPPSWACYHCQSTDWEWDDLPGTGTVFTYTWADQRPLAETTPIYNISIVEVDGTQGEPVRIMTRVVADRGTLTVGLPVKVTFEKFDDEVSIPFFEPRG